MPLLLLSSAVLAQWLSTLASILGLLGGTGGVIGCFCVPGAMYLKVHYKKEAPLLSVKWQFASFGSGVWSSLGGFGSASAF